MLQATVEQSTRKATIILTLATGAKLYLHLEERSQYTRWYLALQYASTRDFDSFYELLDKIGEGSFASVHRARCLTTGRTVAVKCIKKRDFDMVTARELEREMYAMRHLRHANVVTAHDVFNSLYEVHIVMDYMEGGTMKDNVQSVGGRISERFARTVIKQVLTACDFLHHHGYVHRDIKLENVLCDTANFPIHRVRLADFGYVNFLDNTHHVCLRSLLGTPVYIAPEIIERQPYGASVDIYATGVMLYRMISGHYPYDGREDDDKTLQMAVEGRLRFTDGAWRKVSRKCRSFVRALLQPRPECRLTARTALLHPWLCDDVFGRDGLGKETSVETSRLHRQFSRNVSCDVMLETVESVRDKKRLAAVVENGVLLSPVTPAPLSDDETVGTDGKKDWLLAGLKAHGGSGSAATGTTGTTGTTAMTAMTATTSTSTTTGTTLDATNDHDPYEVIHDDVADSRRYVKDVPRRQLVRWSAGAEVTRTRVKRVAWAVAFVQKVRIECGVIRGLGACNGSNGTIWSSCRQDVDGGRGGRLDSEDVVDHKVLEDVNEANGSWRYGDDKDGDRRRRSRRRSSFAVLTGRLGRGASFSRTDGSRRFAMFGDKLKRTVSFGRR